MKMGKGQAVEATVGTQFFRSLASESGKSEKLERRSMANTEDKAEIASPPKGESPAEKAQVSPPEVVSVELPAPAGWKKKFTPKKGGTPRRNEIFFISPTGEELKSKKQLDQYLRSHPGGPPSSEFDWGSGDTPRRSARISEKVKATESPVESEPQKKRERKSSSKKGAGDKDGGDGEDVAPEEEDTPVEDVEMKEAEGVDGVGTAKEEAAASEAAANAEQHPENNAEEVKTEEDKPDAAKTDDQKVDAEEASRVSSEAKADEEEKDKAGNSEVNHPTSEPEKVDSAGKENEEGPIAKEVLQSMNCDDPQHQPKASPIGC